MGYELRVVRESPLAFAELAKAIAPAGFELRGSDEITAAHGGGTHVVARWRGQLVGEPGSDWQVAQLLRLSSALGARLVGEDGEVYALRDGVIEVVTGDDAMEIGKFAEIIDAGPAAWTP
ncbi:hypothetical protein FH608_049250 [Nonomuraea phyllanthi]|uniref:Uncharacterized protein n=1 Tax=Nonomuraea phyllanthi TaxID=2219224 RepID=A0A5C4UXC0_9ACTN|nr:hypothetical protein [Nonomuraea phyllanthi]KAB8183320.1 hypothetical protein FH608_049250 [Nonomuraea phyllanthi]QFY12632.1 hypothetical protein GBF35_44080 [Nonomuraea phyllanthi]